MPVYIGKVASMQCALQHKSNLETLLYIYFIIYLYKYVIMYCKDTFCGTLESVTCIKTLFEAF